MEIKIFLQKIIGNISEFDSVDIVYLSILLLTALAIFYVGYAISKGVSLCRKELKYKKKAELAATIMERLINIQDIIEKIRNPFVFPSEKHEISEYVQSSNIFPLNNEKLKCLVPMYRLNKYRNEFDNFFSLRAQAQLYWKDGVMDLFKELHNIVDGIEYASRFLYEYNLSEEEKNKYQNKVWQQKENDDIVDEINDIISEFRINLDSLYKSGRISWKKIKTEE